MGLAQEGLLVERVLGQLRADAFENQLFAEEGVVDEVGFAHAASAEALKDLVSTVDNDTGAERITALEKETVHGTAVGLGTVTLGADGAVTASRTAHAFALAVF